MLIDRPWVRGVWLPCATVLVLALLAPFVGAEEPVTQTLAGTAPKVLRVVKFNDYGLDRQSGEPVAVTMLQDFAQDAGYEVQWVNVFRSAEALENLLEGTADLSIGAVPIDHQNDDRLRASEAIALKRFRVIGQQQQEIDSPLGLAGMSLAVKLSSPMWPYLDRLRTALGDLRLQVLPDDLSLEDTLQMVSDGIYDAALVATESGDHTLENFPRTKYLFDLSGPQPISWFAAARGHALIDEVNTFIARYHTVYHDPDPRLRTFNEAKQQGRLRVITRLDGRNYFLKGGQPAGFELGLARRFAARHGLRLDVLVARDDDQIVQWLRDGVGDVVTSRIDATVIHGDPGFRMSRDYRYEAAVLVSRNGAALSSKESLVDATLGAYEASANLEALNRFAGDIARVVPVGQQVSLAKLLEYIDNGTIDGAVIDAQHLATVLESHPDLVAGLSIPSPYRYRWTLRGNDQPLAKAVDVFLQSEYRKETYNVLERRYVRGQQSTPPAFDDISPFDELLQSYSDRYGFDWRLIAAQMYQESQFDPNAISTAGAIGLMQLMPATAESLGFDNPRNPEAGIHAGVKYLNRLRNRFERHIPMSERTWLALAAYNIGYDRVRRARARALDAGLNPDKWFGHVEVAMREMSQPGPAYGCRCGQAVAYVRSIRSLYYAYRNVRLAVAEVRRPRPVKSLTGISG